MRKRHTSKGFLSTIQRKSGAVLVYRWYDPGTDGRPTERKRVLGLAKDFRSEAAARREVQRLGLGRRSGDGPSTFKELAARKSIKKELLSPIGRKGRWTRRMLDTH